MQKWLVIAGVITSASAFLESLINFTHTNCSDNDFTCNNLQCINQSKRCDNVVDCMDSSDEMDCEIFHCQSPHYFRCKNGRCVSSAFVCDQENDCEDFSDEENCEEFKKSLQRNATCEKNQWQCSDKLCIYLDWVCDGKPDCLDGSDEILGCSLDMVCDGFKCKNGHCIPLEWRCDNQDDCKDNSDEVDCPIVVEPQECTLDTERFLCKEGNVCIALNQVCDRTKHCPDGSDEGLLCNETCSHKNCTYGCAILPTGPKCVCPRGYHPTKENSCEDIDECIIYGICDQKCRNLPGSYECFCEESYSLQADNKTCKSKHDEAIMLFSSKKEIRAYLLKSEMYFPVVKNLKQAIGVEFDGYYVYWTEIFAEHESIVRALKNGTKKELLVTSGLGAPEDLHIDWWTGNIYFTDAERQHIGVCSADGRHCTVLVNKDIHKPRGIVLNPSKGQMYWTDWGKQPEIARAFMDGTNDTSFVSMDIHWPNGLAIDYPNDRLYWTDAKIMTLESIKLDGTDRRVILQGIIKHPYAISVFENRLFWSDWATHSIQSCEKFTGKDHQTIIKETKDFVFDITIYHSSLRRKPENNPCTASFCSHICLLNGPSTYSCACPQDKLLSIDRHTCKEVGKKEKLILGSEHMLIHIEHQLLGRHEVTALPIFIEKVGALAYNSIENSLYISDLEIRKIISLNLQSGTSKQLPINDLERVTSMDYDYLGNNLYWCDSEKKTVEVINLNKFSKKVLLHDTNNEIPESIALIPNEGVMFVAFQKHNKRESYIDRFSMDGSIRASSIEHGILGPITLYYDNDLQRVFFCDAGTGNIESTSIEGDDRHGFRSLQTSPIGITSLKKEIFWVNENSRKMFWANKYNTADNDYNKKITLDLPEDTEEMHIIAISQKQTGSSPCQNFNGNCSHLCLLSGKSTLCACPLDMYLAKDNKKCISPARCSFDEFSCNTSNICISNKFLCDGTKNCPNGEDETNCRKPVACSQKEFRCGNGECIGEIYKCDGYYHCSDKSDESNCNHAEDKSCPVNHFRCQDGRCIKERSLCDGIYDCYDHEDEFNCVMKTCNNSEFRCLSGYCIPKTWECDRDYDCPDMSDEHDDCVTCPSDMFTCANNKCVDKHFLCNNENDCGDNSDELFCLKPTTSCKPDEFLCSSSQDTCVPNSARCNNTSECPHHEDEHNCTFCHSEEFRCNNNKCIPKQWICDHFDDCGDGSDESSCRTATPSHPLCDGDFQCDSGNCINASSVCDGKSDCYDGSDENGECASACTSNNPCDQICEKTPKGPACRCRSGYLAQGHSCQDVDECLQEPCAQSCHNMPGTYLCDCFDGFIIRPDRTSCKAEGGAMALIYTYDNEIRQLSQTSLKLIHSENTLRIVGMDVDVKSGNIYYTVDSSDSILRINKNKSVNEYLTNVGRPQLISLEWMTNNVYYVNNEVHSKSISVCNFEDKSYSKLISVDTHRQVSALAVDAVNQFLFYALASWWMFNSPSYVIHRTNLAGLESREMVKSTNGFITGLTCDLNKKELYYLDQHNGVLSKMSYDGSVSKVLMSNLARPVGVDFFENHLFILTAAGVMRKCKFYGETMCQNFTLPSSSSNLFVVAQESRQPVLATNPCYEHNCTNLCVPVKSHYMCLCKTGKLVELGKKCEDGEGETSEEDEPKVGEVHFGQHVSSGEGNGSIVGGLMISFCILGCAAVAYYLIKKKNRRTFRISMRFRNPVYGVNTDEAQKSILQPGQHEYSNPIDFLQAEPEKRENLLIDV